MEGMSNGIQLCKDRARRFCTQTSMRYQVRGEDHWREGVTENISSSGVLFRGRHFTALKTQIEMNLALPVVDSDAPAELICSGTVVRADLSRNGDGLATIATKTSKYRFMRSSKAFSVRWPSTRR